MHPTLLHDIETMFQAPPAPAKLKCAAPLEVAARMLSTAAPYQMTSTTVVGVLGGDDVDAFRALVAEISDEYGLEATLKLHQGSYSVRLSRPGSTIIQ
jgi:hypothetical protein